MKSLFAVTVALMFSGAVAAQYNHPYTEWSEKEARKVLNDSGWGKTQVFTDTSSDMKMAPGRSAGPPMQNSSDSMIGADKGAEAGASGEHRISVHIRVLSAQPIRQASVRLTMLAHKETITEHQMATLFTWSDRGFPGYVVIAIDCDSAQAKELREFKALMATNSLASLNPNTYLSVKGQRTYIVAYMQPGQDGLGAKLVFSKEFLPLKEGDELVFHSDFSRRYALNMRFKAREMMRNGIVDY